MLYDIISRSEHFYFFFFQAEDGIRDLTVTGVQTCALPICDRVERVITRGRVALRAHDGGWNVIGGLRGGGKQVRPEGRRGDVAVAAVASVRRGNLVLGVVGARSRVSSGKRRARGHPHVGRGRVTGGARRHRRRHGRMAGDGECGTRDVRSEEHTSELQSQSNLVCRLLLETKTRVRSTASAPRTHSASS